MSTADASLFAAGHGFYRFAISQGALDRSLYYNLLLQPALAIPDHYFLQGEWLAQHFDDHRARDSWIEVGLRQGFVKPHFRREKTTLSALLTIMEGSDRRGFSRRADDIAARVDRTPFQPSYWSSASNSASFGTALADYFSADQPPMIETPVDPDDFLAFWHRSKDWVDHELEVGFERSSKLLGSDGVLLSQMIQVTAERLLGRACGRVDNMNDLLELVRSTRGAAAERDVRVYYTSLCEIYNRSLADTILTSPNSPRWERHVAAMDLWREDLLQPSRVRGGAGIQGSNEIDIVIDLPRPHHLKSLSGDVLSQIRGSSACERYFESLRYWRRDPANEVLRDELVASLERYSREIVSHVGNQVGVFGLRPRFISKVSDVSRALESVPGVVQGFLAVGTAATVGSAAPEVGAGLFTLFCLQSAAKYYAPRGSVGLIITPQQGLRMHADITISRG